MRFARTLVCCLAASWCGNSAAQPLPPLVDQERAIAFNIGYFYPVKPGTFELTVYAVPFQPEFRFATIFSYSGHSVDIALKSADEQYYHVVNPGDVYRPTTRSDGPGEVGTDDFYLGVWIPGFTPDPNVLGNYGWVHLRPVNGELTMVDFAMGYRIPGIVVGTTTIVPEPSTATLIFGLAALLVGTARASRKRELLSRS